MMSGMWNLIFGLVAIAAGASGKFVLFGSPTWVMVGGGAVAALGVSQLWRSRTK